MAGITPVLRLLGPFCDSGTKPRVFCSSTASTEVKFSTLRNPAVYWLQSFERKLRVSGVVPQNPTIWRSHAIYQLLNCSWIEIGICAKSFCVLSSSTLPATFTYAWCTSLRGAVSSTSHIVSRLFRFRLYVE